MSPTVRARPCLARLPALAEAGPALVIDGFTGEQWPDLARQGAGFGAHRAPRCRPARTGVSRRR